MTIKKSLITTDWRAKGLKANPGTRSFRACFLLLILMMVCVAAVSAALITGISPTSGSQYGNTIVTITGTFTGTPTVNFSASTYDATDSKAGTVTAYSTTSITVKTPPHALGLVNVFVSDDTGITASNGAFTYTGNFPTLVGFNTSANTTPSAGSAPTMTETYWPGFDAVHNVEMKYIKVAGGSLINLSGSYLTAPYYVTYTGNGQTVQNATTDFVDVTKDNGGTDFNLTMKTPAHSAGTVTVTLYTANGSVSRGNLTYVAVPVITAVSPAYGSTFGTGTITISGTGDFGSTTSVFFNKTQVTTFLTKNGTAVTLTLPAQPISGPCVVNITTVGGDSAITAGLFTIYDPPAIDTVSNPSGAYATSPFNISVLGGTTVNIYGKNFTAASMVGATVKFNGTAATSVTRVSDTQITAVAPAWPFMTVNTLWQTAPFINIQNASVNVTTLGGISKDNFGNITYDILKPNITSISPTSGSTGGGVVLTITGKNLSYARLVSFNPVTAGNPVLYNTSAGGVTVVSDTQITCIIPSSTLIGDYRVNVTTPAGVLFTSSDVKTFTYTAIAPVITTVSPNYGPDFGGQWVNITGSGFSGTTATGVIFNGQAGNSAYVFNDTSLTVNTPAYPKGISFITINAAGGSITKQAAYTFAGQPQITSLSPVSGSIAGGNTITINGRNLTGASVVTFNFTRATGVTVINDGQITAILPAANQSATGSVNVNVTTYLTSSSVEGTGAFNYGSAPTLTSISPVSGSISGGTLVTLFGANLANATSVTFGGLPGTNFTRFDAATQVTVNTPATTTPGVVYPLILTPSGSVTNSSVSYTYYGSPVITSISPSSGPLAGGNLVTITGTSFVGASQVTFDGTQATNFTYVDSTKITANAPAHAAGAVTVLIAATGGTGTGTYTYAATPTSTVGVFRNGAVYLAGTNTNGGAPVNAFSYGMTGDKPVVGQWTSTQTAKTIGVFRGSSGMFYLRNTNNNGVADTKFNFGQANDVPVSGHWSGAGIDTVGVFRTGTFFLAGSNVNGGGTVNAFNYGMSTDVPVAGDWTGNGATEVGIFRNGLWALASSNVAGGGTPTYFTFGQTGDVPVTGDWNADGATEVGVFRNGMIFQATPAGALSGYFNYGMTSDLPVGGYFG